jgi:Tol biopolymer transport system component
MHARHAACAFAVLLLAAAAAPRAVQAQYFGQNVVRHDRFDFRVLETENFDIHYYPEQAEAVQQAALMAERWNERLSQLLDHRLTGRQPLILYANHPHFRQTNTVLGGIGEGTGGVTEAFKRRVVLPFAGSLAATDHVLGHELVHAFQFDITGQGRGAAGMPTALRLPLWFIEGMAEYLSIGPFDPHTAMWMRDAVLREELPSISRLDDWRFFPYRYGHAFWAYVAGRWGDEVVGQILKAAGPRGQALTAIEEVLGVEIDELSEAWHESLRTAYDPIIRATQAPNAIGQPLLTPRTAGHINVGPALSPDGRRVVFLSERDLLSIDLFLADAETGEIIRRLVRTAADPHFDSLQFINSAGGWHPDNRRFVFSAIVRARPVLTIVDTETGRTQEEIRFEELGEIFNPKWSPDGRAIAFSANVGGFTNLYVYEMEEQQLRQLTDDAYAAFDPAWSADGRRLAFVTDRFTTNLDRLSAGPFQIGVIDVQTGEVSHLAGFEDAKNINPQWSRDGRHLYFLSDRQGITNVYRTDLEARETTQVTNIATGVSGISADSPALSVAAAADRLVFSAFEGGDYNIYAIAGATALAGSRLTVLPEGVNAAMLPPRSDPGGEVAGLLGRPAAGLPEHREFQVEPYRSRLSLDFIGQPTVAVGADRFGAFLGGGISFMFSDMLGHHQVATTVQVNGGIRDFGGLIGYQNRTRRFNWGGALQRVPILTGGGLSQRTTVVDGTPVLVEELFLDRQIYNQLGGLFNYPFSRAHRVEFGAGVTHLGFDREVRTRIFSLATGRQVGEDRQSLPSPAGVTFGEASTALVYDTSLFGATSPILGRRYRLEYGQMAGDLQFANILADYREYVMPVRPFTIAGRVLHFGRYGGGAEDPRLFPLFVGYPNLVRGYALGSFSAGEQEVFNRLIGSRLMVANVELRWPLLGVFTGGRQFYGPLPLEGVIFGDAGVAWQRGTSPSFFGGDREPVTSVGAGVRMNVFGFAVVEVDFVRPLQRPQQGWMWQFSFQPGF